MHKLQIEVKKCFGKGFGWICALNKWSVQECTQTSFLPCSSSGIALFGMRSVQADSCLNSEHIDALCISVGGQEGLGGGGSLGRRPENAWTFFRLLPPYSFLSTNSQTSVLPGGLECRALEVVASVAAAILLPSSINCGLAYTTRPPLKLLSHLQSKPGNQQRHTSPPGYRILKPQEGP